MIAAAPAAPPPRRRRRLIVAVLALAVAAGLVTLAPHVRRAAREVSRDEAGRRAEAALEDALGAEVEIEEARLPTLHELTLRGVRITEVEGRPEIEALVLQAVRAIPGEGETVAGSWSSLELLEIDGAVLTLRPPERPPDGEPAAARPPPRIARLIVRDALVVLQSAGAGDVGAMRVEGEIDDWGGRPHGSARAKARHLPLRALAEAALGDRREELRPLLDGMAGCCDALEASVVLSQDGSLQATGRLVVPEGFPAQGEPERVVDLVAGGGPDAITLRASGPGLLDATLALERSAAGWTWSALDTTLPRLPTAWLHGAVPADLAWSEASVTAHARREAPGARVLLSARAPELRVKGERLRDAALSLTGLLGEDAFDGEAALFSEGRPLAAVAGSVARDGDRTRLDVAWALARENVARHERMARALGAPLPRSWRILSAREISGRARGVVGEQVHADLEIRKATVRLGEAARAPRAEIAEALAGVRLDGEEWRVESASVGGRLRHGRLGEVSFEGSGEGDLVDWRASAVAHGSAGLGQVRALASSGSKGGSLRAELGGGDGAAWLRFMMPELSDELGLQAAREPMQASLRATWDAARTFRFEAAGSARGLQAQSADSTRALSVPALDWNAEGQGRRGGPTTVTVAAGATGAQLLWGTAFADLSGMPPALRATLTLPAEGPWHADAHASLGRVVNADARVTEGAESPLYDLALQVPDVAAAWEDLGSAGVLAAWPQVSDTAPSGSLRFRASGTWTEDAVDLHGEAAVVDGAVRHDPLDLAILGLQIELPLRLVRSPGDERLRVAPSELAGRVRAGRVAVLGAEVSGVDLPIRAADEALQVEGDVALSWLGGRAVLSRVRLRDPLLPDRALQAGVSLQGLQLERLGPVGPFTLGATVSASFPSVSASATSLDVEGGASVRAWGGEILVDEISGTSPWSRFPRTRISARFEGIDLFELTSTFGFGAMTGVIAGEIEDLELFGLTPVGFRARVQSVEQPGVKQAISIPALQNLATLATGGRAPLFDKGLLKLVRTLRYAELGAEASLRADAFMLRGLAERHGRELFLKGRLPLRVDVANAEPGATVSFRAMMARLAGLDAAPPPAADAPEPDPDVGDLAAPGPAPPSDERTP